MLFRSPGLMHDTGWLGLRSTDEKREAGRLRRRRVRGGAGRWEPLVQLGEGPSQVSLTLEHLHRGRAQRGPAVRLHWPVLLQSLPLERSGCHPSACGAQLGLRAAQGAERESGERGVPPLGLGGGVVWPGAWRSAGAWGVASGAGQLSHVRAHGLQHSSLPCPSPTPGVYSNSCPLRC